MAKMTMHDVTYEGTPEELREVVRTFEVDVVEPEVAPKYKTEKRHAKVGERILITTDSTINGQTYKLNDVLTVTKANVCSRGDVNVEGQPSFVDNSEYEVIVEPAKAKAPADKLSHNGADYSLVQRKAQAGDVVILTETEGDVFNIGEQYEVLSGVKIRNGSTHELYKDYLGRTEVNVLVYEKVAAPFNVGDIVMTHDTSNGHTGVIGEVVGRSEERPLVKTRYSNGKELTLYSECTLICPAESRVDTK